MRGQRWRKINLWAVWGGLLGLAWLIAACQTTTNQIFIEVDGRRQSLTTEAETVREALAAADVILEPLDRVSPDLYTQLEPGLVITVTRVTEETEIEREVIPFERQVVTNEALLPGETKLAQLGINGEDEITIRVLYEDGEEVSRSEVSRETVSQPQPEILVVGPQEQVDPTPLDGTVAYLSNGNAWLMRDNSGNRRALTTAGDLDGRVFSLSPDGRRLAYTRALTDEVELPLNELWLASTTIVNEPPTASGLQGILQAEWSPVISQTRLAYSTAKRTVTPPGWQANNDLWLLTLPDDPDEPLPDPVELLPANTQGLYPWWGMRFTWSPDGQQLAYARPDQIGVIDTVITGTVTVSESLKPLTDFVPLQTFSEWVWVPQVSWSPDGRFIAATVHGSPLAAESPEESQIFDLWLFSADGSVAAQVAEQVGMWANPVWSEAGIAFGQALNPLQSATSRYTLQLIDRDGSNQQQLFPVLNDTGVQLPEMTWSPDGTQLLFIYNGDLYLTRRGGSPPRQLTSDSQASHPRWVQSITAPPVLSATQTVTPSATITATLRPSRRETITATPPLTTTSTPIPGRSTPFDIEEELKKDN